MPQRFPRVASASPRADLPDATARAQDAAALRVLVLVKLHVPLEVGALACERDRGPAEVGGDAHRGDGGERQRQRTRQRTQSLRAQLSRARNKGVMVTRWDSARAQESHASAASPLAIAPIAVAPLWA